MSKITVYIREARQEIAKVIWPSRQTIVQHTIVVIAVSLALAAFLGVVDYAATFGFETLLKLR